MAEFVEDVLIEILSWLPTKSLLRFKCVNKQWHSFISDPQFAKIQHRRSPHNGSNHRLIFPMNPLQSVDFDINNKDVNTMRVVVEYQDISRGLLTIVGECNGLIAVLAAAEHQFLICNPIMPKQFVKLPDCPYKATPPLSEKKLLCGLGYDSSTDDYKLVMSFQLNNNEEEVEIVIFSLRRYCWRRIRSMTCSERYGRGTYWDESLHWLIGQGKKEIVSLDLKTEEFHHGILPLPTPPLKIAGESFVGIRSNAESLFVYSHSLHVSYIGSWVISARPKKGRGWTKLSISNRTLPSSSSGSKLAYCKPLWFTRDGKTFLLGQYFYDGEMSLISYEDHNFTVSKFHLVSKFHRGCNIYGMLYEMFWTEIYVESLISPLDYT